MRQGCTVRKGQIMQGLEDHVKNFGHFSKVNVEFLVSVMKKSYILKIFMCKRKKSSKIYAYVSYTYVYMHRLPLQNKQ